MATFSRSGQQANGNQAGMLGPSPVPVLAHSDRRYRRVGERLWAFDNGRRRALRLRRLLAEAETDEPRYWSD